MPVYPPLLESANLADTVTADYVVNTDGRAIGINATGRGMLRDVYVTSVVEALRATRFEAAERGSRRVAAAKREIFVFRAMDRGTPPLPILMIELPAVEGTTTFVIGRQPRAPGAHWGGNRDQAAAAVVRQVLPQLAAAPAVCIGVSEQVAGEVSGDAVVVEMEGLRTVPLSRCPPTLRQMFQKLDSIGNPIAVPASHVDPYRVTVRRTYAWTGEIWVVEIDVWQGTLGRRYMCTARTVSTSVDVTCDVVAWMVS